MVLLDCFSFGRLPYLQTSEHKQHGDICKALPDIWELQHNVSSNEWWATGLYFLILTSGKNTIFKTK